MKKSIHFKSIIASLSFCFIVLVSINVNSQTTEVPAPIKVTGKLIVYENPTIAGEVIVACPTAKANRNCTVVLNDN